MHQSNSLDFKLVQRVCLLQQALDQALSSLDELKAQVKDKQWIETQLASTEQYANVQQQAIAHLKHQLAQFTEVQNHLLSVVGYRLNELIDHQQQAFHHLHIHCHEGHAELQTYLQYLSHQRASAANVADDAEAHRLALEAEVMVARSMAVHLSQHLNLAQQHLGTLKAELGNHHLNVTHIVETIHRMIEDLQLFDGAEPPIQPQVSTDQEEAIAAHWCGGAESTATTDVTNPEQLQTIIHRQNRQIQELETLLMEQVEHSTHIRQNYQHVAAERNYYKEELEKLQRQLRRSTSPRPAVEPPQLASPSPPPPPPMPSPSPYLRRSRLSQPIQPLRLPADDE